MKRAVLDSFHIIAITHRQLEVNQIGLLHINTDDQQIRLQDLRTQMGLNELLFLSTCNRVEFMFTTQELVNDGFINNFISSLYPNMDNSIRQSCRAWRLIFWSSLLVFWQLHA
jgi:glutamyl-tRNA reductase